ncbi:probable LRR receptor-like serine/threonine-protein kinase At3g47570 [Telopea speciosissima]|uniref:probable LRR receptor-like serine/threonine-protein kinase At3g47570 n=1 Tax=Telopea speciosissima TaxID=54955 RepID=UPI001CC767CE|nr:probable LRR receptor-like serine/threonine-protein kinase At3g47570 [Telopea speciosissima]
MALLQLILVFNILLLFGSSLRMIVEAGNNKTDQFALLEFKKQIDVDPYGALSSWNDSIHFCNWVGITCGSHFHQQQRVITLDLQGKGLGDYISPSIGNLTFLHYLHIGNNSFHGKIPQAIGEIPASFGNISSVEIISLSGNGLRGSILESFGQLTNLYFLALTRNKLSEVLDLRRNGFVGHIPNFIANLSTRLSMLILQENHISGSIPAGIENLVNLTELDMSQNFLEGTIPQSLTLLKGLQDLDLSQNNLFGQIPNDLQNLLALRSLNLSFSNLEGEVPTKGIFANASAILVNGNDKLCGGIEELHLPTCTNHGFTKRGNDPPSTAPTIIGVVLGVLLISFFLTCFWLRRSKSKPPSTPLIGDQFLKVSYKELFQATGGFSSANFISSGSFGSVYKWIIDPDETIVAVKVLNLQNPRVYKSFMAECKALRNIRHRNLVKIISSCSSLDSKGKDFKALVYEFMPNGSLYDWLHLSVEAHNHSRNLSLLQKLNIAIDVASALDYLHYHCYATIVHCDLKPSNILLDSNMTAHVSDFGLARLLLELDNNSSQAQTSTIGIKGSTGNASPEYGMGGRATIQGDVFSYGILLLEMLTGKRPTDQMFTNDLNPHNFAKAALPVHVMQILDPTLLPKEEQNEEIEDDAINRTEGPNRRMDKLQDCITSIIEIALQCSMESPRERMSMNDICCEGTTFN